MKGNRQEDGRRENDAGTRFWWKGCNKINLTNSALTAKPRTERNNRKSSNVYFYTLKYVIEYAEITF